MLQSLRLLLAGGVQNTQEALDPLCGHEFRLAPCLCNLHRSMDLAPLVDLGGTALCIGGARICELLVIPAKGRLVN